MGGSHSYFWFPKKIVCMGVGGLGALYPIYIFFGFLEFFNFAKPLSNHDDISGKMNT